MKIKLMLLSLIALQAVHGQNVVDVDKNTGMLSPRQFYTEGGQPFSTQKYVSMTSGSPFFSENWMKGTIATDDSTKYNDIRLKLDLVDNNLVYLNDKNEELVSVMPILKVSLRDTISGKTFLFTHSPAGGDKKIWYQVLTLGDLSLYKQIFKDIYESKAYGSSITEQAIRTDERYFVYLNNIFSRIKKPADIADLIPGKKEEILAYVKQHKLSGKKETDFISTIEYYNSLKK